MPDFAVIFDLDGTMVDNVACHKQAWGQFCAKHRLPFSDEIFHTVFFGRTNQQVLPELFGKSLGREDLHLFSEEKEKMYRLIFQAEMKPVKGLMPFLEELRQARIPAAVATSAPPDNVDFVLNGLKLKDYFPVIVDDTMVTHGKPDPEIFLTTARLLKQKPGDCVVFEDSLHGTKAAFDAGCKVVALTTTTKASEHKYYHHISKDFRDISVNFIRQKFNF